MKQTAVEWYGLQIGILISKFFNNEISKSEVHFKRIEIEEQAKEMEKQQKGYGEEEMLKILYKFAFDYTYNYKGEKTIYEWVPEWFEEYKRIEEKHKNK